MGDRDGHARHDPLDVAAAADRGASLPMGLRLCVACLDLRADLAAVAAAVPMAAIPRRPRDFRLTAVDAARLRSHGWRRLLDAFGSARDEISRPLAVGFATLGVVGLVMTTVPAVLPMSGAGAARASDAPYGAMVLESATGSVAPGEPVTGAMPQDAREDLHADGPSPLLLVSGALLGTGGVLFAARALAKGRRAVR